MKVSKRVPFVVYTVISILLLLGLLFGLSKLTRFGKFTESLGEMWGSGIIWDDDSDDSDSNSDKIVWNDETKNESNGIKTFSLPKAENYYLDFDYCNITVNPTEGDPHIVIESNYKLFEKMTVSENGNSCNVKQRLEDSLHKVISDARVPVVKLYLPKEAIERLEINVDAGQLTVGGIEAEELSVSSDMGKITVGKNAVYQELEGDIDLGNAEIYLPAGVTRVDFSVDGGESAIYLPKDIPGVKISCTRELGSIKNNSGFNMIVDEKGKSSVYKYGDESCKITMDIDLGAITINSY